MGIGGLLQKYIIKIRTGRLVPKIIFNRRTGVFIRKFVLGIRTSGLIPKFIFFPLILLFSYGPLLADDNCLPHSKALQHVFYWGCELQTHVESCQKLKVRYEERGLDLQGGACHQVGSSMSENIATSVMCSPLAISLGTQVGQSLNPQWVSQGTSFITYLTSKLGTNTAQRVAKVGSLSLKALSGAGQVLTAFWVTEVMSEALQDQATCFQDVESKRASLRVAERISQAVINSVRPYVSTQELDRLKIPEFYSDEKLIRRISCTDLKALLRTQKSKQDKVIADLIAKGDLKSDPRQNLFLDVDQKEDIQLLAETLTCLPPQKQIELICAIGNIVTGASQLKQSLHSYQRTGPMAPAEFARQSQKSFQQSTDLDEDAEKLQELQRQYLSGGKNNSSLTTGMSSKLQRSSAAESFVKKYEQKMITTKEQNLKNIALSKSLEPQANRRYFYMEHSQIKRLNDTTNDKAFVTASINRMYGDIHEKIQDLEKSHPGLKVYPGSTYKNFRVAFEGDLPPDLEPKLQKIFTDANLSFADELKRKELIPKSEDPLTWFKSGFGETADQANYGARYARASGKQNEMVSYQSSNLQQDLRQQIPYIESKRREIEQDLKKLQSQSSLPLLEKVSGHSLPSKDLFELVRKNPDAHSLQAAIVQKFGVKPSLDQSEKLLKYSAMVDQFTLEPYIAQREITSFTQKTASGITLDFVGMGAINTQATAAGLSQSKNLDEALRNARLAEQNVTENFDKFKADTLKEIQQFLYQKKGFKNVEARCSGDDCIAVIGENLPEPIKRELIQRLSRSASPSGRRISFVSGHVESGTAQNLLAAHGEEAEKFLRTELNGRLAGDKLKKITFAVDMKGSQVGTGAARLIIGNSRTPLSAAELQEITKAHQRALEKLNQKLKQSGIDSNYSPFDQD